MGLGEEFAKLKFDKRMRKINSSLGLLTDEEYQKHIESLENVEGNATSFDIEKKKEATSSAQPAEPAAPAQNPEGAYSGGLGPNGSGPQGTGY